MRDCRTGAPRKDLYETFAILSRIHVLSRFRRFKECFRGAFTERLHAFGEISTTFTNTTFLLATFTNTGFLSRNFVNTRSTKKDFVGFFPQKAADFCFEGFLFGHLLKYKESLININRKKMLIIYLLNTRRMS